MSDVTTVNKYPKASYTKAQVDQICQDRLGAGARSCNETEDATTYIVTTVWPGTQLLALIKQIDPYGLSHASDIVTLETRPKTELKAELEADLLKQGASSCHVAELGAEVGLTCPWTRTALMATLEKSIAVGE